MYKFSYKIFTILIFLNGCGISTIDNLLSTKANVQQINNTQNTCTCMTKSSNNQNQPSVKAAATVKNPDNANKEKIASVEPKTDKKPLKNPVSTSVSKKSPLDYIIEKTKLTYSKINISQVDMYTYSKGEYKDGIKTTQTRETFERGKLTIKNPGTIMINISDSDDPMAKGSTILYPGSGKVKVKGGGFLGIIPVSFDITDPKLSNSRNQKLTAIGENINRLTATGANLKILGTSTVSGRKVYMIRSDSPIASDPEITYEIFAIDSTDFFLISNEMYKKDEMVSQYLVKSYTLNPNLDDKFFTL